MTVFGVHHTTTYRYRKPVRPGQHQLMFRPRDSFDQRLLDYRLKVTPEPAEIRWLHDVFGNCVTLADLAAYIRRHHPEDAEVEAWLSKFVTKGASRPTGQLLMTLNEAIAEGFSY